jgi:hypothetical protein
MSNRLSSVLILGLCLAFGASAGTIYSDVTAGFPADGATVTSFSTYGGMEFTATGSGNLATISVAMNDFINDLPDTLGLYISSGGEPGTLLETWSTNFPMNGVSYPLVTLTSAVNPFLLAGTQYWFVVTPAAGQSVDWLESDEGVTGLFGFGNSLTTVGPPVGSGLAPGIEVTSTSTSTPEPGTAPMFALGSVLLLAQMRRMARR